MSTEQLLSRRLIFVAGKGGVGKTTVAAALGMAAVRSGRRVLVCELGEPPRLTAAFGVAPRRGVPVVLAPGLEQLWLDAGGALREWLRRQPGGAAAAALLTNSAAFQQFAAAGPGIKELVLVGKLGDLASDPAYDLVIVDAPSSGHAVALLTAPRTFAGITHSGRIGRDAVALWDLLRDAERTAFAGVALPEEMPVQELLELHARLAAELGHGLDAVVADQVWPQRYSARDERALHAAAGHTDDARALAFLRAALAEHDRARAHARRVAELRASLALPVTVLPDLRVDRLRPGDYARLADVLVPPHAEIHQAA